MNRSFLAISLIASLWCLCARGQAPAEVLLYEGNYEMKSPSEAHYDVRCQIRVNSSAGLEAAVFSEFTDEFKKLSSFSGSITSGGKVVQKLRKQDVITQLQTASLAEKTYLNLYEPTAPYPFIVEYSYSLDYQKAIASFPSFSPVPDYDIPVRKATYTLSVPASIPIQYKASQEPVRRSEKGREIYSWQMLNVPPTPMESGMPEWMEWAPYVYACPIKFEYVGTTGSQQTWKDIGQWNYDILPKDPVLPETLRQAVLSMISKCETDLDKVVSLYGYLREHTRYVSIQLGIGGYVPASPEEVARTGFGDCKALSFYMKQLLALAGISSDYAIVSTRRKDLLPDYASLGQMNHALLRVPLQQDTIWVECTNPSLPLGYCHSGIAGHEALLILPEGGELVRIGEPAMQDNGEASSIAVKLSSNGSATVVVQETASAGLSESYVDFMSLKPADKQRGLLAGLQCHPDHFSLNAFTDNFAGYDGRPGYVPSSQVTFSFDTEDLARINADRMFVKLTPYSRALSYQKTQRRHDFIIKRGYTITDSIKFTLPEAYEIEYLPEAVSRSTDLMDFFFRTAVSDHDVRVCYQLTLKPGRIPPEDYDTFKELVKMANQAYASTLILKAKQPSPTH